MPIDRREFLRRAGRLGAAAAAMAALPGCRRLFPAGFSPGRGILDGSAAHAPIDHVVVVMMENRSFDHYLGWLADDHEYLEAGRRRYGRHFAVDGKVRQTFPGPGGPVTTQHLLAAPNQSNPYRGCGHPDPGHGWDAGRAERDGGFLAAGSGNDEYALGYYLADDLPFTAWLARRFTTFDGYHASLLGPTFPNREYLHSAQSGGHKDNYLPIAEGGFAWETIWDRLGRAGVPARYYASDLPFLALWGGRLNSVTHRLADYYADCAAGTLPNVVMVDPTFFGPNENDDHPDADIRAGQRFLRDVFSAFVESPHWRHGLFVLVYDEWGGFFDHAAPPQFADDRASGNDRDNFAQAGFRVPAVIASPYALHGFVDDRWYDHTSILRFLEWRFLGAPAEGPGAPGDSWFLTTRDRHAANLGASLRRHRVTHDDDDDLDDLNDLEIGAPSPPCASTAASAGRAGEEGFRTMLDSGYLERVGARTFG